jgi:LysR substrate binding domain
MTEVDVVDPYGPYGPLRRGEVDLLVNWLAVDEPDLTIGPVIDRLERVLALSATHPLAGRSSISWEELAEHEVRADPHPPIASCQALRPTLSPSSSVHARSAELRGQYSRYRHKISKADR